MNPSTRRWIASSRNERCRWQSMVTPNCSIQRRSYLWLKCPDTMILARRASDGRHSGLSYPREPLIPAGALPGVSHGTSESLPGASRMAPLPLSPGVRLDLVRPTSVAVEPFAVRRPTVDLHPSNLGFSSACAEHAWRAPITLPRDRVLPQGPAALFSGPASTGSWPSIGRAPCSRVPMGRASSALRRPRRRTCGRSNERSEGGAL